MKTLNFVPPGEPIQAELNLTCAECGITSRLVVSGYTLERDALDVRVGRIRFMLQAIFDDISPLCGCILDGLSEFPRVGLYIDGQYLN